MAGTDKKGKPSGMGRSKGSIKNEHTNGDYDMERDEELREQYLDDEDEPANNIRFSHPNRNPNK